MRGGAIRAGQVTPTARVGCRYLVNMPLTEQKRTIGLPAGHGSSRGRGLLLGSPETFPRPDFSQRRLVGYLGDPRTALMLLGYSESLVGFKSAGSG